jgi:hypothetical protein
VIAAEDIVRSPAWLPLEILPGGHVRLVRLDEAAYRQASFLDQRLLASRPEQQPCPLPLLEAAAARLPLRAHYVFHIGHVGSTLLSRLIGEHRGCFALREPALLRTFAAAAAAPLTLEGALALLGRTWRVDQRPVIKLTSILSELAGSILGAAYRPAGLLVFAQPLAYLQGILAGPNSRVESRQLAPLRLRRLAQRLGEGGWRPDPHSEGEQIAMSWLCEMMPLQEAAQRFGSQVLWVDFDAFLAAPRSTLETILRALGASPAAGETEALVSGPLMHQYSKAPEYAYDAALRRSVLSSATREHGVEIRRGLAWLEALAARDTRVAAALAPK